MSAGGVLVTENGQGRYQQAVQADQHHWIADEPESMGGTDAGPTPFDLLLASLGSCTSITLRMYAERKQLTLRKISVSLSHDRIEVDGTPRDRIQRSIALEGDLSDEQRRRLLEIANKCPIHRLLAQPVVIVSNLVE